MSYSEWTEEKLKRMRYLRLAHGLSSAEIAQEMGVSPHTVEKYLYSKHLGTRKKAVKLTPQKREKEKGVFWQKIKNKLYGRLTIKNGTYFCDGDYRTVQELAKMADVELPVWRG